MPRKIDISHKTIIFTVFLMISLWIIYLIRDLLLLLFVALILMSALSPVINFFTRLKIPRALAILITYIIIIGFIGIFLTSFLHPLIEQSSKLLSAAPTLLASQNLFNIDQSFLQSELSNLSHNLFSVTITVFDNLVALIFLLVLSFYILLEKNNLEKRVASLFKGKEERVGRLFILIEEKLGAWFRGQLFLSLIIAVLVYTGLTILNVAYALPLALLAGLLEVVPVIGPIISAIPAIVLALTSSTILAAGVAAMYFVIQQTESHVIVPQVMKRVVGLNPLMVIMAIAIGGRLLGIAGALLAVPITVVVQIIVTEILENQKIN